MLHENEKILLFIFSIMLLVSMAMVFLFVVFNNRKNKLLRQRMEEKQKFEKELAESQVEIREETLRNISWELHDNIGQLVTLAKIHIQNSDNDPQKVQESADIIGKALDEVRALSKSINPESIKNMGLIDAVNNEIERFKRMRLIKVNFEIIGGHREFENKEEIIIFRILQEFFSNTVKHSRADELKLKFQYDNNCLMISCKDNGIGFETDSKFNGIGIINMKNRAKVINATLKILSKPGEGTELRIKKLYK